MNTSSGWLATTSDEFKEGFVAGVAQSLMTTVVEPTLYGSQFPKGYAQCMNNQTLIGLVGVVEAYMDQHPETNTYDPAATAEMAFHAMCAPYLPKAPHQ
ncbi:MAG: hypothetical protein ACREFW_04595 [Rhizomicrobium sp.]